MWHRFSSISKAIEARAVICAQDSIEAELRASFPQAIWLFSGFMEMRGNYNSGRCNAVIITLSDMQRLDFMDDFICNSTRGELVRSYEAVLKVPVALPASQHVAPALSYWMKTLYYETKQTYLDFERPYHRPPGCAYEVNSSFDEGALSFGITHMSGVLLLLVASAALAVFVKLCCTAADKVHERTARTSSLRRMHFSRSKKQSTDGPAGGQGRPGAATSQSCACPAHADTAATPGSRAISGARRAPDDSDPVSQLTLGELRLALAAEINKASARTVL